jgi:hypothetical protein
MNKLIAVSILLAIGGIARAGDVGTIRICRYPGLTELMDHKSVVIPKGSGFIHSKDSDTVDHSIVTTADATLGPKPACVNVAAMEGDSAGAKPITAKTGRFIAAFYPNIAGLTAVATAVEEFHPAQ